MLAVVIKTFCQICQQPTKARVGSSDEMKNFLDHGAICRQCRERVAA